tara:strand:- start:895 stop:2025 length:1131 start_codon:yes stop_codon:yes gene_type:complete
MKNNVVDCDILVIGGGFYGTYIAEYFSKKGLKVALCEKEKDIMLRASYMNQARVHNGYHYPRSTLTALKSRISFPLFIKEFKDCIDDSYDSYYMVGKILSNITSDQFKLFCKRISAFCEPAPQRIVNLTNSKFIEDTFRTIEYAFDAIKIRKIMNDRLFNSKVSVFLGSSVKSVSQINLNQKRLMAKIKKSNGEKLEIVTDNIYNCTYSMINSILYKSNIDLIPLKHEMTEICLVDVPDEIKNSGITVMCGPFFSTMPFPSKKMHTFSHVRYTPHYDWEDRPGKTFFNGHKQHSLIKHRSAWRKMLKDACKYIPILEDCQYHNSLWEVKTILPSSEIDDSRPILFKQNHGLKGLHSIMGGKIDNIYDIIQSISKIC